MDLTLRPARETDVPRLIEIARRAWLAAFAQTAPFALITFWAGSDRTAKWYEREWRDMIVAEEDGVVIGLVQPKRDEINGLWVHPARHGAGAGSTLLRAGEDVIRAAGHSTAWLVCSAFNDLALRFYRARGYREVRRDPGHHECGIDYVDIRMERSLAASASGAAR